MARAELPHRTAPRLGSTANGTAEANSLRDHTTDERTRVRNRRRRFLDIHPEYFGPSLELADPLLYERLVRRYQSAAEREAEGRARGFAGVLEADLWRGEAKMDQALQHAEDTATASRQPAVNYRRGPAGEVVVEEVDEEPPRSKEEGLRRWREEMTLRFVSGHDDDFDYRAVDQDDELDDLAEETRVLQERYFDGEDDSWAAGLSEDMLEGETGVQDF